MKKFSGFTLAELLIALAILGVIATFTIPKVLASQQDSRRIAIVKEAASMFSDAYNMYKLKNPNATATLYSKDLTEFMNYVNFDTSHPVGRADLRGAEPLHPLA